MECANTNQCYVVYVSNILYVLEQSEILGFESHDDDIYSEDDNEGSDVEKEIVDDETDNLADSFNVNGIFSIKINVI